MPKNVHLDPDYQKKYRGQSEHIERQQRYKKSFLEKKNQLLKESIGDCCSFCGTKENLELDHIDPKVGGHHKARGHRGKGTSLRHIHSQLKLDNLRWLCKECHREHSALQLKVAWDLYLQLPLDKQEELLLQYKQQK